MSRSGLPVGLFVRLGASDDRTAVVSGERLNVCSAGEASGFDAVILVLLGLNAAEGDGESADCAFVGDGVEFGDVIGSEFMA